jgi:formylglycine-generating enzyme required for sulfatase activity
MIATSLDRTALAAWYAKNRGRTRRLFDILDASVYHARPISLRNPVVFYEGHLPAFSAIAFLERGLGEPPVDADLERLFARGIDPESEAAAVPRSGASTVWPERHGVLAFAETIDRAVSDALGRARLDDAGTIQGLFTALEHEAMHQETLLYMWRRIEYSHKRPVDAALFASGHRSAPARAPRKAVDVPPASVVIPRGRATLGASPARAVFGWDNEFDEHVVDVAEFEIDVHDVTNAGYLAFVEAGGPVPEFWTRRPQTGSGQGGEWFWRGMFEEIPLPLDWPVYVSHDAATAYARWKGRRLPTEAEYQRAAFGSPSGHERLHPWGDEAPDGSRGNFDFASWEPVPVGAFPSGASAWGVHDLVGNGWEWTSSVFAPFEGFEPMASYPEYSAEFFDGQHYVLKGASPATARELVRRSFRNWFRPNYPYVYAAFRTAR